jgi:hypothetical protein
LHPIISFSIIFLRHFQILNNYEKVFFCLIVLSTSFIAKAQCFLEPNSNGDTIAYKIKDSINHYVTVVQYLGP